MPPFWYICFEKWLALDLKFMELHDEMTVEIAGLEFNWNWPDKNLNQPRHTSVALNSL